ncbi:2OG-Fe(II) oxygenase [Novosphingobium sp. NPDC080210]|uniref:2OG-Fe(II) oxygenase n=1 Tax=Novosphingobium sp. NPDC080210 TaxID=3390596 RepID=UPI003D028887
MALFRINPRLDANRLHADFQTRGRIHIPDFLVLDDAERLLQFLKNSTAWHLVLNSGSKVFELDRETQAALTPEQRSQLEQAAYAEARYGFQYCYETIRVADAQSERAESGTLLDEFAQFLSSPSALAFLKTVVGDDSISFADAQGTAYGPGHFLTAHDDAVTGKNRRAAFVFNLSQDWSFDWGGLLAFHERGSGRAEVMVPCFNAINLFAVPQLHSVTMVAPFAPRRRYSVTGWLRSGPRP